VKSIIQLIGLKLLLCVLILSLKTSEQRRSELFAKQGRGQQFTTVKERDAWIKKVRKCVCVCV